jgi:hypothetical protein
LPIPIFRGALAEHVAWEIGATYFSVIDKTFTNDNDGWQNLWGWREETPFKVFDQSML